LDIIKFANKERNLEIFNDLLELFRKKEPVPDNTEFPRVKPLLENYSFPSWILTDEILSKSLSEDRINRLRFILQDKNQDSNNELVIKYIVPWAETNDFPFVDLVFSQAVLQHIENIEDFFKTTSKMLLTGGFSSHEINFSSHGETWEWNGHWAINDKKWKKMKRNIGYSINREPLSRYLKYFNDFNFTVVEKIPYQNVSDISINRNKLIQKYINITEADISTSSCFIIARKK
jgi:hypothetical protein